ncbi:MAG: winged helix-turn-helix domain-containing protein, partial [Actinomycetota bacterium]|nr:winged helix-turn-helix domain-containing protein [Actinomycetota bacterium]
MRVASTSPPRFRIHLLGRFQLLRDGEAVPEKQIGSKKGRTLLKLLAVNAGTSVPVDRIVDALWASAPPARAEENVATLVSRLRAVIGAGAIEGGRHAYSLVLGPLLEVDLGEAERLAAESEARLARSEPTLARVAAERATRLLGAGELLAEEPDAAWADDA